MATMLVFAGYAIYAQDEVTKVVEKGPLSLSLRGNIINSDIFSDSNDNPFESQTGFGLGVAAEYDLPWYDLSMELAVDRLNLLDEENVILASGVWPCEHFPLSQWAYAYGQSAEFNSTDLSLSLKYNFKQLENYKIVPYVLGGVGYLFNDFSLFEVDNSFETHVGAGLNYLINEDWSAYAEGRYLWSSADVSDVRAIALNGEDRYKVDLDSFIGMVGLKYRF